MEQVEPNKTRVSSKHIPYPCITAVDNSLQIGAPYSQSDIYETLCRELCHATGVERGPSEVMTNCSWHERRPEDHAGCQDCQSSGAAAADVAHLSDARKQNVRFGGNHVLFLKDHISFR